MKTLIKDSGSILEKQVISTLSAKGFEIAKYSEWFANKGKYGKELLLKHVPYNTIYKHRGKTEFLLKSEKYDMEIRIECKWQQVNGSVDEKLPYLYLNCIETMPEKHIIIVLDGDGWKPGAKIWLKETIAQKKYISPTAIEKQIYVMDLKEFLTWANRIFI